MKPNSSHKITKTPPGCELLLRQVGKAKPDDNGSVITGKRGTGTILLTLDAGKGIFVGADSGFETTAI